MCPLFCIKDLFILEGERDHKWEGKGEGERFSTDTALRVGPDVGLDLRTLRP